MWVYTSCYLLFVYPVPYMFEGIGGSHVEVVLDIDEIKMDCTYESAHDATTVDIDL